MKFSNKTMTALQITNTIKSYIDDSIAGLSKENPKLDFKDSGMISRQILRSTNSLRIRPLLQIRLA